MSLLASRHQEPERASVLLPTVKCSSCGGSIPLSALGEHVCRPSTTNRPTGVTRTARPSQISIPDRRPQQLPNAQASGSNGPQRYGPGSGSAPTSHPSGPDTFQIPPRPPYASSNSSRSSPGNLSIPSPNGLFPSPQVRTPSPTNPFFPHPTQTANPSPPPTVVHGLGLGVGNHMPVGGSYPGLRPAVGSEMRSTEQSQPPQPGMPDTTSGGGAGMAGVGRRAFAAAAWGVRAGVALAAATRPSQETNQNGYQDTPSGFQSQNQSQFPVRPTPQHQPHSAPALSQGSSSRSGPKEPPLLPKVPLSGRQRSGTMSNAARPNDVSRQTPQSPPQRSASALSSRSNHDGPDRRPSFSSTAPDPSDSPALGSSAVNSGSNSQSAAGKLPFFEKYKQLVTASSSGSGSSTGTTPILGLGRRMSSDEGGGNGLMDSPLVASPVQTSFNLDDDDLEGSALPWATPSLNDHMPPVKAASELSSATSKGANPRVHNRYNTEGSVASSTSSLSSGSTSISASGRSGSGRRGPASGSGEDQEVVTPSQSWEGLAERADGHEISKRVVGLGIGEFGGDSEKDRVVGRQRLLAQIGEEDEDDRENGIGMIIEEEDEDEEEGERLVFGATPKPKRTAVGGNRRGSETGQIDNHSSRGNHNPMRPALTTSGYEHSRSKTVPDVRRGSYESSNGGGVGMIRMNSDDRSTTSRSTTLSSRRTKTCVKCHETVGGSRRFVERDGVVLCERDWKLLYLPCCRKCSLPIEKSAVSSSDGQLKGKWHKECFGCSKCGKPFLGDSFYVLDGKPWCQLHYHEENGTICSAPSCRQPIEGPCILSPSNGSGPPQRFHPGHLRCDHRGGVSGSQSCRDTMDEYYDVAGGRYCERHVGEVLRREKEAGRGGRGGAEKRRTRLVDLPMGGF